MKISIIGAGNVATHLAINFAKAEEITVVQIISKTEKSAKSLAEKIYCEWTIDFDKLKSADLYIIATNDDSIETVAKNEHLKNKFIVHTSGSSDMSILTKNSTEYGVFYPMQTFKKSKEVDFSEIPIFIEASTPPFLEKLEFLAKKITKKVYKIDSKQRKFLHISAVFANNFTNHLLYIAQDIAQKNNLDFEILKPLIKETFEKVLGNNPFENQTGPARRNDEIIISKHIESLSKIDKNYSDIYKIISESIKKTHTNN
ncbi:MAG: DUF2520 domain-containing protein [Bacteroidales bacterium]|nr:DUF2520 domain-containing protein [Bacteroidales bacterium]